MATFASTSFKLWRASLISGALFLVFIQGFERAHGDASRITTLAGTATIIDGDTIEISGYRIRLEGIDAPETAQTCEMADGSTWACGREATKTLRELLKNTDVACDSRSNDKYGRMLATCFADGKMSTLRWSKQATLGLL